MASIPNTEVWREFFRLFKELPSLYAIHDDVYKNKGQKQKDWNTLLEKYKEIYPHATLGQLKKKVHNVKFCYRRVLQKIEDRARSGYETDEEYVTNLWYFNELDFLRDYKAVQHPRRSSVPAIKRCTDTPHYDSDPMELTCDSVAPSKPKKIKTDKSLPLNDQLTAIESKKTEKDDTDIFAENWATQFRKLLSTQQLFAKKIIEDALFLGQLGQLSITTAQALSAAISDLKSSPLSSPSCI